MNIALGGERVGSGNKMNLHLRHYERSTHNLSQQYKTSAGIGILYPCLCIPVMRGDKFDINIAAGVRTVPSKGAMFGSYKLQIDYYFCANRLYTGILHNNPYNLGMKMNKVYFPQFKTYFNNTTGAVALAKFNTSSLLHYLGLSGMGYVDTGVNAIRNFNAVPILAYYDIFKNYYSNKQEPLAYVLTKDTGSVCRLTYYEDDGTPLPIIQTEGKFIVNGQYTEGNTETLNGEGLYSTKIYCWVYDQDKAVVASGTLYELQQQNLISDLQGFGAEISFIWEQILDGDTFKIQVIEESQPFTGLNLTSFPLENLDEMRAELLSWHTMGAPYIVNDFKKYPYAAVAAPISTAEANGYALNGLMIKTYQSDIFNNWLSSEFIDGVNGIANITRVNTEGGGFTIDALNFSEKMYRLLNRIVVAGNTYEDWQNVVYEETPKKHLESPMYLGGESQEIVFEEIVATAVGSDTTLGSMGGRGISRHRKGGHVRVKVDEAGFIIGIMSITPRIDYSQGNEFYFTDLFTMDDFHKPALDGIGFQDLIGERMAYFDTHVNGDGVVSRHSIGKLPAWIEYMTAVDKVHGDLADGANAFMVLNRNYEFDSDALCIRDATTYVEPNKYNDTFYYTDIDSQNFWVQINHQIIARRKMSAKQIPNI